MTTADAPAFATIFRDGEGPMVATLADSLQEAHPGSRLFALALGNASVPSAAPSAEVLKPDAVGVGNALLMLRLIARPEDARTAVVPVLLAHLLDQIEGPVTYIAPDTAVRGPLPPDPASGIAMLPRTTRVPAADGRTPTARQLLALSMFDDGFLSAAPDAAGALRARTAALDAVALATEGVPGRIWDLLAAELPTTVVDDPALGVAYWNAADRVGPVTTARLPGLDPTTPWLLSRDQGDRPRILLSEHPELRDVVREQLAALRAHGMVGPSSDPTIGDLVIDGAVRMALRQALLADGGFVADLEALAADESGESLAAWLGETVPGSREPRISRYLLGVWGNDSYASAAFPNPTDDQSEHLIRWARESSGVLGIPSRFLPRPTDAATAAPTTPPAATESLLPGVNLIGFLRAGFGIGEATRLLHEALIEGDIPHSAISVSHDDLDDKVESSADDEALRYDINLICVNVDWLEMLSRRLGSDLLTERYFIGTWWWESNLMPPHLVAQIDYFDELWAGSTYVAEALAGYTSHPIRVFPLPVRVPELTEPPPRNEVGLPEGYLFMFSFDMNSTVERKNPDGVIAAFRRAFPTAEGPQLVLKTINGHRHLAELERLRAITADRDDITVYDGFLPTSERDAWARATDCYVSLHRSEGFGLTMAEAMALGKPVIATAYSANLDFMNDDVGFLVPASEWVLPSQAGPYPAGTVWADPDVEVAADFMRRAASDPGAAALVGSRARDHIARTRTAQRLAEFISNRLEEIRMEDPQLRPRPNARLTARLNDALSYDRQRQGARQGLMARMVNRIIRPYTASADELDRRTLAAMVEIGERLDDIDRTVDSMEQNVEALHAQLRERRGGNAS